MSSEIRIPVGRLKFLQDVVFGRKSWGGPDLAQRVKAKHVTLWSWLNRNGLPVKHSEAIAVELERRASDLTLAAELLREEAQRVLSDAPEPSAVVQPVNDAQQPAMAV